MTSPPRVPAHLDKHNLRVMTLERGRRLGPLRLQLLAVAAPGGVELQQVGGGAGGVGGARAKAAWLRVHHHHLSLHGAYAH